MTTETVQETIINEKVNKDIQEPGKYKVIFLNDNVTPMEFVTEILIAIFKHSRDTAEKLMLQIHEQGNAIVGTYYFEIAEQKTTEATLCARQQGFPLGIQIEKE